MLIGNGNYIARMHASVKYCICRLIYCSSNCTYEYRKYVTIDCANDYLPNLYKCEGDKSMETLDDSDVFLLLLLKFYNSATSLEKILKNV